MKLKLLLPALTLVLAILACNIQTGPTTPLPITSTNTSIPPVMITNTSVPLAITTNTPIPTVAATNTPVPPPASGLTLDMLRNGTYSTPFYNRTITLVNGAYSEGSGATTFSVQMLEAYAFGDLNGDGKPDAAVLLAENGGGSGVFESLIAVLDQGGAPHQISTAELGDRVQINGVDISSGVIHLNMLVQGPSDPLCCPSLPQKQNYWLIGNSLWLMRLTSTIGGTEHIINVDSPANWATVTNPFTINGSVTIAPFENTLGYRIYLPDGTKVNESSLMVDSGGIMGGPGTFSQDFDLSMAGITGLVIIQFLDLSAADGSTIALGAIILDVH